MIENLQLLPNNLLISFPSPVYLTIDFAVKEFGFTRDEVLSTDPQIHGKVLSKLYAIFAFAEGAVDINTALVEKKHSDVIDVNVGDTLLCVETQNNFMIGKSFDIDFNLDKVYFITEFLPTKFNAKIIK